MSARSAERGGGICVEGGIRVRASRARASQCDVERTSGPMRARM